MNQQQWRTKKDAATAHALLVDDVCGTEKILDNHDDTRDSVVPAVALPSFREPRYRTCEWAVSAVQSK